MRAATDAKPSHIALEAFAARRASLLARLDEAGGRIDSWLGRTPIPTSLASLANLEVLIKERRDLLTQLVALDDELMVWMIQTRGAGSLEASAK